MSELRDFEEDLYKCSRCGLCQSVCPVYKASLSECAVSKGKFNMLNGVLKGELQITRQMKKYLDMCTGCNACKKFCPSGIDAKNILICAKEEYYKNNKKTFLEKLLCSYKFLKFLLIISKPCFFMYRFLHFDKTVDLAEPFLLKLGVLGRKILLLNYLSKNVIKKKTVSSVRVEKKAVYFEGCINKYINPQSEEAVIKILKHSGIKLIRKNFECCGVMFLNDGNIEGFRKLIDKNLSVLDDDFDCILTDCASCCGVLKKYKDYSENPMAEKLALRTKSFVEIIQNINFESKFKKKVAIHLPCHEENDFSEFIKTIKGLEFVEVESYDKCCGFSGTFSLKNPDISAQISKNKAKDFINAGVDIVLTTCPACLFGLEQGFIETNLPQAKRPKVKNLFVFLSEDCDII